MKFIAIEVFKYINNLYPAFMQTVFIVKEIEKDMRDPSILILPRFRIIVYGKKTFSCHGGAPFGTYCPQLAKNVQIYVQSLNSMLKKCRGPKCSYSLCSL